MTRAPGPCRSCEGAFRDAIDGYAMCGGCNTVYIQNYGWRVADQTEIAHMPSATMPDKSPGHRGASADPGGVFTPTGVAPAFPLVSADQPRMCPRRFVRGAGRITIDPLRARRARLGLGTARRQQTMAKDAGLAGLPARSTIIWTCPAPCPSTLQAPPAEAEGSR